MARPRLLSALGLSYVLDWVVIVALAGGGAALNYITGYHRPFALTDVSLAFPLKDDIVSITVVAIVAFLVPAFIIAILCLIIPPRPSPLTSSKAAIWRRKLWDLNAGLLGLALSLALTLLVTTGLKDIIGKPRPDLLARCNADVANITDYIVGGFGTSLDSESSALVTSGICRQPDHHMLDDGFASFPSGHSSFSWAGLLYLSLWLCSQFSIAIPYLGPSSQPLKIKSAEEAHEFAHARRRQAAPPLYLVVVGLLPCGVALFICATRYTDFHHAGWDIAAGSAIGILFAWASFRTYHLPVRRGLGTSWAARPDDRPFLAGRRVDYRGPDSEVRSSALEAGQSEAAGARPPPRVATEESSGEEMVTYVGGCPATGESIV